MNNPSIRPIASYYIFLFLIIGLLATLFLQLALVNEILFFRNINNDLLVLLGIIFFALIIPKKVKLKLGENLTPVLKILTLFKSNKGDFEQLEAQVYEQRRLRLEEDIKIKSNPLLHTFVIFLIILSIIGFVFLMIYSATGNF